MAVDGNGNVASPSYVTGVAAAWTVTHVKGSGGLSSVSCPSSGLCVAGDYLGNVVTSTSPTGGAAAWTGAPLGGSHSRLPAKWVPCARQGVARCDRRNCVPVS